MIVGPSFVLISPWPFAESSPSLARTGATTDRRAQPRRWGIAAGAGLGRVAKWNDSVKVSVRLSEPAYFHLLGYNFDGREQLLWPGSAIAPSLQRELDFPSADDQFFLNDDAPGGVQVFVVAASRDPLPAWDTWQSTTPSVTAANDRISTHIIGPAGCSLAHPNSPR